MTPEPNQREVALREALDARTFLDLLEHCQPFFSSRGGQWIAMHFNSLETACDAIRAIRALSALSAKGEAPAHEPESSQPVPPYGFPATDLGATDEEALAIYRAVKKENP